MHSEGDYAFQGDTYYESFVGKYGTSACFIFKLAGDGTAPERFDPSGNNDRYQNMDDDAATQRNRWPKWGGPVGDLSIGTDGQRLDYGVTAGYYCQGRCPLCSFGHSSSHGPAGGTAGHLSGGEYGQTPA